jgi:hypothetical protein
VKFTIQLSNLILAVKHNLCYWISKSLVKHTIFPHYNRFPKFTDNQRITDIYIYIYIYIYICMHICSYMLSFLQHVLYTVWRLSKSYVHNNNCKKNLLKKERKRKEKHNSTDRARGFNAGLLARSQFASRRSCDRPTRSRFPLVPEQMLSWYPNSTLHCMLPMQPSQW